MRVDDLSGHELGGYQIVEKIGYGGMAFVYRAVQIRLNRPCALKILRPELAEDERFVRRFLQEAQAAANLNHPNIVTIYDTGEIDGYYYIAMEYLSGRPLQDLMATQQLDLVSVVDFVAQASSALDYAHNQGVVHRDIKPGNMIISDTHWLTLTDFGIAHLSGSTRMTTTGTMLGTPVYMAPEQIQGEPATAQTDIYQLGITLYEMLAGRPPFEGDTPQAVFYSHFQEMPASIHERNTLLSPDVDTVVNRALKKVPAERYSQASDLAVDLAKAVEKSDPSLQLQGQITMMTTVRRSPPGSDSAPTRPASSEESELATADVRTGRRWLWIGGGALVLILIAVSVVAGTIIVMDRNDGSSTVATAPPATSELPERGEFIFEESFEPWLDDEVEGGWKTLDNGEFTIGLDIAPASNVERSTGGVVNDGSVSTEIQMAEWAEGDQDACLLTRADTSNAFAHAYSLCINSDDETFAVYEEYHENGSIDTTILVEPDRRLGTRPAEEWNELEIVSRQNEFWFLVNGRLIGSATHDGDSVGVIGVAVHNSTGTPAVFIFRNLNIRTLT